MDEGDFVPHESLEDDEELKLHVLGGKELWTQSPSSSSCLSIIYVVHQ